MIAPPSRRPSAGPAGPALLAISDRLRFRAAVRPWVAESHNLPIDCAFHPHVKIELTAFSQSPIDCASSAPAHRTPSRSPTGRDFTSMNDSRSQTIAPNPPTRLAGSSRSSTGRALAWRSPIDREPHLDRSLLAIPNRSRFFQPIAHRSPRLSRSPSFHFDHLGAARNLWSNPFPPIDRALATGVFISPLFLASNAHIAIPNRSRAPFRQFMGAFLRFSHRDASRVPIARASPHRLLDAPVRHKPPCESRTPIARASPWHFRLHRTVRPPPPRTFSRSPIDRASTYRLQLSRFPVWT
jgi:hypothetical protein